MSPAAAPAAQVPSNEECLLAALAHGAIFFGFWMVGPLAVYAMKRTESRHASFHAMQALVLWAIHVPVALIVGFGGLLLTFGLAAAMPHDKSGLLGGLIALGWLGCIAIPTAIFLVVSIVAAVRAYHGRTWSIPVVGGIARRLIALDKDALQP